MKHGLLVFLLAGAALTVGAAGRERVKTVLFPFREAVIAARAESTLLPYRFKLGEPFEEGAVLVALDDSRYAWRSSVLPDSSNLHRRPTRIKSSCERRTSQVITK